MCLTIDTNFCSSILFTFSPLCKTNVSQTFLHFLTIPVRWLGKPNLVIETSPEDGRVNCIEFFVRSSGSVWVETMPCRNLHAAATTAEIRSVCLVAGKECNMCDCNAMWCANARVLLPAILSLSITSCQHRPTGRPTGNNDRIESDALNVSLLGAYVNFLFLSVCLQMPQIVGGRNLLMYFLTWLMGFFGKLFLFDAIILHTNQCTMHFMNL